MSANDNPTIEEQTWHYGKQTALKLTGQTVWVATSRYVHDDELILTGVGTSKEAAEAALEMAIQSHNEDETFDRDLWIDEVATELPVFTV